MPWPPLLLRLLAEARYPLLFATVSGAHLYGFASPDSDFDLRGVHLLPAEEVVGLDQGPETLEVSVTEGGVEVDRVTHDAAKFFRLLLKRNGYVLEQLCSPLVLLTTPAHAELLALVPTLVTRWHANHYLGFAHNQWRLFGGEEPRRVKRLLYTFRTLLTGIHLMQTGEVEANLLHLNDRAGLPYLPDLIAHKQAGPEHSTLPAPDLARYEAEFHRLLAALEAARDTTHLPDASTAYPALHDLLVRLRLDGAQSERNTA